MGKALILMSNLDTVSCLDLEECNQTIGGFDLNENNEERLDFSNDQIPG
ncbi:hypothetical protein LV83_03561 [Algoriphagus yeomjeoni]|uniref:Uncharacterized protein n=1 Tax=Algoriphagus yeomjeoni TaxID=291403 RepID=A0A327P0A7_9BACT|nr:hypothetical protein LV83_03561 [Algoriphagus yeomjeoni]